MYVYLFYMLIIFLITRWRYCAIVKSKWFRREWRLKEQNVVTVRQITLNCLLYTSTFFFLSLSVTVWQYKVQGWDATGKGCQYIVTHTHTDYGSIFLWVLFIHPYPHNSNPSYDYPNHYPALTSATNYTPGCQRHMHTKWNLIPNILNSIKKECQHTLLNVIIKVLTIEIFYPSKSAIFKFRVLFVSYT